MIKRIISIIITILLFSGCNSLLKPKPENFILEQDTTDVWSALNSVQNHDFYIWFQGGTDKFAKEEQLKFQQWINNEQPSMICLRGTGGAEKYRDLAHRRSLSVITYLQTQHANIDMVMLDYDSSLRGGRVLINEIPEQLAAKIRASASMLVINSN